MANINGLSLRQALIDQGVTTEEGVRLHLTFVHDTLTKHPKLDCAYYRVNPDMPNVLHHG